MNIYLRGRKMEIDGEQIMPQGGQPQVYDLDDLIGQMTPETFHDEIDFGPPMGQEVW